MTWLVASPTAESEGARLYDKENLLWQFTVAIRSDPAGPQQQAIDNENDYWLKNEDGLLIGYDPKKYIMLLSRLQLMKKICRLVQFWSEGILYNGTPKT